MGVDILAAHPFTQARQMHIIGIFRRVIRVRDTQIRRVGIGEGRGQTIHTIHGLVREDGGRGFHAGGINLDNFTSRITAR